MTLEREKFDTFDALRFFSFLIVFLSHLPYQLFPKFGFLQTRGDIGVSFFFTLSGFLITYIILVEKKALGNFNFKKYMLRRILRIWPLYYAVLLFAFLTPFILSVLGFSDSGQGYVPNWFLSAAFLENYMVIYHNQYANVSPLPVIWSLCIEEHFYVIWGLVLYFGKSKNIPFWILGIIILSVGSRIIFDYNGFIFKDILTNFDAFMYGAIPAYLYVSNKEKVIAKVNTIQLPVKVIWILMTAVYCFAAFHFDYPLMKFIEPIVLGILFMGMLFMMLPKQNPVSIGERNIFSRLGVYTYGLYLFHTIAINLAIKLYEKTQLDFSDNAQMLIISGFSLMLTIIASVCSYHLLEKPFLRLKPR